MAITKATGSGLTGTKYNNVSAGNYYMDLISRTTVGSGGTSSITFSNIPSGYKHLQLRGILRTSDTGTWNNQNMQLNSDTGSNYKSHTLLGDGATATAGTVASTTAFNDFMRAPSNSLTAGIFGVAVVDILDYANTNKYKTIRVLQGGDSNGAGIVGLTSGVWMNTNPVTTIKINPSGGTAIQYSSFALYGIRG